MPHVTAQLNARLMPMDRGVIFEDPLDQILREAGLGSTDGAAPRWGETGKSASVISSWR